MIEVRLYNGLVKATREIVAQFGKEILAEQKFVNIYLDLYPDRDHPAKFRILRSIISEGVATNLQSCNENNIVAFANQQAEKLERKYGYDKSKLKNTLYSLAVGADVISDSEFKALFTPKQPAPKPVQIHQSPSPKPINYVAPPPEPYSSAGANSTLENLMFLLVAFGGVIQGPFVYLKAMTGDWWMFPTLFVVILLNVVGFLISYHGGLKNAVPNRFISGMYSGLALGAALFIFFGPFFALTDVVKNMIVNCGYEYHVPDLSFFSILLMLIGVLINSIFILIGYSLSDLENNGINDSALSKCTRDTNFTLGFILSLFLLLLIGLSGYSFLTNHGKMTPNDEKQTIAVRTDSVVSLTFKDFKLGEQFDSCMAKASDIQKYMIESGNDYPSDFRNIYILEKNFASFVDSVKIVKTDWGGDPVVVGLFAYNDSLMAIKVQAELSKDDFVSFFSKKYGRPEKHYKPSRRKSLYGDKDMIKWTFKNAMIEVYGDTIIFFDRRYELI